MFKACHSMDSPTTLCQSWFIQWRPHIMYGFIHNFVKICLITNTFNRRENRWPRSLKCCLWLYECFGIQCLVVWGNTSFGVCGNKKKKIWSKVRSYIFCLKGSRSLLFFKDSFNHWPISIWKNQTTSTTY
jgi:hypothetical protein